MKRLAPLFILAAFLLCCTAPSVFAEAAQMDTQVARVALFKNGLGFFVREGKLPDATDIELSPFSTPTHGTFWVSYPKTVGLDSLVARETTTTEKVEVTNIQELLQANVGKKVSIVPGWEAADVITGTLLSVPEGREERELDPYAWGRLSPSGYNRGRYMSSSRLAMIQTKGDVVAIDLNMIRQVSVVDGKPDDKFSRQVPAWQLRAKLSRPAPGQTIAASYLAKGITWAPSYIVDISDPKKARISAKALIINEAEELKGVHVDLVTGFPNLQFADILSPIAGKEKLAAFLSALGSGASARGRGDMYAPVMAQRMGGSRFAARMEAPPPMPEYGAARAGETVEDFFFYPIKNVSLAKGETGYFPLFSASVPYTQVYTWDIPDYVNAEDSYGRRRNSEPEPQEEVWHSLKLTNKMELPWTTAPAQTVKDGQLLGQDTLEYTSAGGDTTLKITRAMGVKAEQNEFEVDRQREAARLYGYIYDRVSIEGRLQVANYKKDAVDLEIKKTLSGEVKETSLEAQTVRLARGLTRMNPVNELTWKLTLKPGEAIEIVYSYDALIRR